MSVAPTSASSPRVLFLRRAKTLSFVQSSSLSFPLRARKVVAKAMAATGIARELAESTAVKPPSHPTYDLKAVIALALSEDAGDKGDITCLATIPKEMDAEATFIAKENGVIAGISLAEMIFNQVNPSLQVEWSQKDGDQIIKGMQFGKVYGCARSIIVAERVVLNFMQRMSGIATLTKAMAEAAHPACILETRKTAPGLRLTDKWAVCEFSYLSFLLPAPPPQKRKKKLNNKEGRIISLNFYFSNYFFEQVLIGGGKNHRLGLFDMVMIKDNHISVAGGVSSALKSVDEFLWKNSLSVPVEVETRTLEEVKEVLKYAAENKTSLTRIMLDNMVVPVSNGDIDVSMLKDAVKLISGRFETEASGNVTLETVREIGETGVSYISSGALTHSVKALDISLKIDTELALQVGKRTNRA